MKVGALRTHRGPAAWLAIVAVLTLLMSPVLAGRAHAAMLVSAPTSMAMGGMAHTGKMVASAPCRHDEGAACWTACALASQLLPPTASDAIPPVGVAGRADYAVMERSVSETVSERSTPPPR